MARRTVGNLLGLTVLAYLVMGPQHPYELSKAIQRNGDARSIRFTHGSLYMVVGQLERAGFVAARETVRDGQRPERTVYALTDAGRQELRDWLRELVETPQHEYPSFVAALSVIAALRPDEVTALLGERRHRLEFQRAEIRDLVAGAAADGVHPLFLIEEEYRLALLDAEVAFVEGLVARIADWRAEWEGFHVTFDEEAREPEGEGT